MKVAPNDLIYILVNFQNFLRLLAIFLAYFSFLCFLKRVKEKI
jgi:hypothetical protein